MQFADDNGIFLPPVMRNPHISVVGLTVMSDTLKAPRKGWSFILPGATTLPMHATTCYLYGQVPAGAESTAVTMLKTDRMYSVFLNGRPDDPSDSTYGYKGKFCLITTANSGQQVIPIKRDMRAWIDEVCPANIQAQKGQ